LCGFRGVRLVWSGLTAWLLLLVVLTTGNAQAPVITPNDVATPTPGAPRFPTPTPAMSPATTTFSARSIHLDGDAPLTYTVQPGDTLFSVALEMGIDLEDAPCAVAPTFTVAQPLVIGDVLTAPPANMLCHEVKLGETLAGIAARYLRQAAQIRAVTWNLLPESDDAPLPLGTHVRVPLLLPAGAGLSADAMTGAAGLADADFLAIMLDSPINTSPFVVFAQRSTTRKPVQSIAGPLPADWPYGSGDFVWPVYGWLSQSYRYDHRAIDIAAPQGTPITAADRGVVLRAGWNNQGYGQFVIIDHQIDYVTLYAHLDRVLVKEGEIVGQGQVLGTVGSTGNSTGPHLHFEIRDFGRLANPLEMLAAP
jgi:murein DD-endopeptidase MepM/ murein hydrolase activator NlpD